VYEYIDNQDGSVTTNQVDTLYPAAPRTGTAANFVNCATDGAEAINETCVLLGDSAEVFNDYASGDYTPKAGGPLVNKGANYEGMASVDLAGNPRKIGSKIDIGCYELRSTPLVIFVR
jgi:hypothetical protein